MARTADSRRLVGFAAFLTSVVVALALAGDAHAATFTVTKTEDTNDLVCDADCSLREAIDNANNNGEADIINVPAGTYALTIEPGDLSISADGALTIAGPSARTTIIDQRLDDERVISIDDGAEVEIAGLTITGGDALFDAGGISVDGGSTDAVVTLRRVTVTDNVSGEDGGAIENDGELTIIESTLSNNRADDGGGAIENDDTLTLINSTVSGNAAGVDVESVGDGGGIDTDGDDIEDDENTAVFTSLNSTIVANTTPGDGGGLSNEGTNLQGLGGGVSILKNTIVANNDGGNPATENCERGERNTSEGDNLENLNTCGFNATGDRPNTDPLLGPLQDNGGPTDTHALLAGSPAIDAAGADCPATDQRGTTRPQGPACDIGAYEVVVAAVQQQQQQTQAQTQTPAVVPTAGPPLIDTTAPRASIAGVRRACVASNFTVRIRARDTNLRRVRVFLDGRRIRSTTQSSVLVTVRARRLKAGRHRLTVVASDEAGNRRRVTRRFARCARLKAPPAPRFTG